MVQADFNHGVEYEGMYFLSRGFFDSYSGSEQSYLVSIAVHETAHQWWYGQVANDQALEPWLDEALCTFSELAYYEQLHPESVAWWWAVRVDFYQPYGRLDRSIYGFTDYADQYLEYRNATYLQGAKFLSQLKSVMGEEAFYGFLRDYAAQYRNKIATTEDFFALLGDDLDLANQAWIKEYFPDLTSS
jgi:aminopeptidase N